MISKKVKEKTITEWSSEMYYPARTYDYDDWWKKHSKTIKTRKRRKKYRGTTMYQ